MAWHRSGLSLLFLFSFLFSLLSLLIQEKSILDRWSSGFSRSPLLLPRVLAGSSSREKSILDIGPEWSTPVSDRSSPPMPSTPVSPWVYPGKISIGRSGRFPHVRYQWVVITASPRSTLYAQRASLPQ